MSYKVKTVPSFDREAKKICRKHPSIKSDIAKLIGDLEQNPRLGTDLGQNIYKIRLAISSTNKGKSGGARLITCVVVVSETVILSEIYLKNEHDTVDVDLVIKRLKQEGVI